MKNNHILRKSHFSLKYIRWSLYLLLWGLWISLGMAQPGQPHMVTFTVWNSNGSDYPQGTEYINGLIFECWLKDSSNQWTESAHYNESHVNPGVLDYYTGDDNHQMLIQLSLFTAFSWEVGDSLIVFIRDIEDPFIGESGYVRLVISGDTEPEVFIDQFLSILTDVNHAEAVPDVFALEQNFPNPFNPETTIKYQLPEDCMVSLKIFDVLGREVRKLVHENQQAGYYSVIWNGLDNSNQRVPSGLYFIQMAAGDFQQVRKINLMK